MYQTGAWPAGRGTRLVVGDRDLAGVAGGEMDEVAPRPGSGGGTSVIGADHCVGVSVPFASGLLVDQLDARRRRGAGRLRRLRIGDVDAALVVEPAVGELHRDDLAGGGIVDGQRVCPGAGPPSVDGRPRPACA